MKAKKAQATGVATFIVIMALFMLAYVLLLPEEERKGLIDEQGTSEEEQKELSGQTNLLYTSPGNVFPYEKNELKIPVNSVALYAKTEEKVSEIATKLTASKNWFSDEIKTLTFKIDNKDALEKLQLFFFVTSGEGAIYVKFNGYTVFEGEISSADSPINLPTDRAKSTNTLTIGMSSGDFAGDSCSLSSISIKQSYKSEKSTETRNFQLTAGEKAGLKKAQMTYFINCQKIDPKEQGDMTILLNGNELSTERVICDAGTQTQSMSMPYIAAGRNTLEFKITKGEYNIEGIEIELETKEKYYPKYSFELSDEYYEAIKDGEKDAFILFKFPNDKDTKKATVTINEYQISFDTKEDNYERKVSGYLERGANYVKIIPKIDFEISSLKIYVAEPE